MYVQYKCDKSINLNVFCIDKLVGCIAWLSENHQHEKWCYNHFRDYFNTAL